MSFSPLQTPINTLLLVPIAYYLRKLVLPSATPLPESDLIPTQWKESYSWLPAEYPPVVVFQKFTPQTLQPFNGKDDPRILLAIKGKVFDVSAGASFYGPDGMYGNFSGRDASRGMAKQSFDLDMLTPVDQPLDTLQDLTPSEVENMQGWIEHFSHKYIVCGELVENGQA